MCVRASVYECHTGLCEYTHVCRSWWTVLYSQVNEVLDGNMVARCSLGSDHFPVNPVRYCHCN